MPPDTSWSDLFNKSLINQNPGEVEWKTFANECLMETEIFKRSDLNCLNEKSLPLDPRLVMDVRHEMARNFIISKGLPSSKEQLQTEARKLLREENRKRLIKQKEERVVKKEIDKLKALLENDRLLNRKELEASENDKGKHSTVLPKFGKRYAKLWKRLESYNGFCEIDTWFNQSVQMTMETQFSQYGTPVDVKVHLKRKEAEEEMLERLSDPVSSNRKGSVVSFKDEIICEDNSEFWDHSPNNHKNEIMQRFFASNSEIIRIKQLYKEKRQTVVNLVKNKTETSSPKQKQIKCEDNVLRKRKLLQTRTAKLQEFNNKSRVEHAWELWRNYTAACRRRNKEKINYENKIEAFLARFQEKTKKENSTKKERNQINTETKTSETSSKRAKTALVLFREKTEEKKKEILRRYEKKEEQLQEIMREVKTSRKETLERLKNIKPQDTRRNENFPIPDFLLRMEKRREERSNRWKVIRDRKRQLKEERESIQKQKEEQLKLEEENEKKKQKEMLKEKRRLEKEREKEQKEQKEKLRMQIKLADAQYQRVLLGSYGLKPWLRLMKLRNFQQKQALDFREERLLRETFSNWKTNVRSCVKAKEKQAEDFHQKILLRNCFGIWIDVCEERVKQFQVAVDWNDLKITEKTFTKWRTFVEIMQLEFLDKKAFVDAYYEKKLKIKYLKIWQNYPELRRIEVAKEKRKRIWRQKVQEILPDYRPLKLSENV